MTRGQLWVEVRYRLIVLGLAIAVVAGCWFALRGSIHYGPPSQAFYEPAADWHFSGKLLAWKAGQTGVAGWVQSDSDGDCDWVGAWVKSSGQYGYVGIGPLAAHQGTVWTGYLEDTSGRPVKVSGRPSVTFNCYRWTPRPTLRAERPPASSQRS